MLIEIVDVGQPNTHAAKNGRSYQSMEVTYRADGKVASKKLMSFSNPSVFTAAKSWTKGEQVNVVTTKDDQGYWQWTGIGTGEAKVANSPAQQGTRVAGSNYETKEERAARQVMIVRQSSISSAVAAMSVGGKNPLTPHAVIAYAQELENYVMSKPDAVTSLVDMADDIPV